MLKDLTEIDLKKTGPSNLKKFWNAISNVFWLYHNHFIGRCPHCGRIDGADATRHLPHDFDRKAKHSCDEVSCIHCGKKFFWFWVRACPNCEKRIECLVRENSIRWYKACLLNVPVFILIEIYTVGKQKWNYLQTLP